jgi:hypothetical protein
MVLTSFGLNFAEVTVPKKLKKSEKLDRILSEISAIRSDLKKLLRQSPGGNLSQKARPSLASRPKKSAKRARPQAKPKAKGSSPKPVLVQTMPETQPTAPTPLKVQAREG